MYKYSKFKAIRKSKEDLWGSFWLNSNKIKYWDVLPGVNRSKSYIGERSGLLNNIEFLLWKLNSGFAIPTVVKDVLISTGEPSFKGILHEKQKLKMFYRSVHERYFRGVVYKSQESGQGLFFFLNNFERRLDVILYRSNFVRSFSEAGQLLSHGWVKVNGFVVHEKGYKVSSGDIIVLTTNIKSNVVSLNNLVDSFYCPSNLEIDYEIMSICFLGISVKLHDLYHFKVDFAKIFRYY